jgi:predicted MFS family arabinose efflux permease
MGIGRFAYTPLIVVMRADAGLSVAFAGILASVNLAGYLAGALLAMHPTSGRYRVALVRGGSVAVVVLTAAMALPSPVWLCARFFTGVASGLVFVLVVSLLLDESAKLRSRYGIPVLFSGVGCGIAFAGAGVPLLAAHGGSRVVWLGLAAFSALALAGTLPLLRTSDAPSDERPVTAARDDASAFAWLCVLYGIEGAAYIIPATFLVAMIAETSSIARYAAAAWVLVGLVAAPSVLVWRMLADRIGLAPAFLWACFAQVVALVAPLVIPAPLGVAILAAGLGGTFIAIAALGTAFGRHLRPANSNGAIGLLTVLYGAGQIVGPLAATQVALRSGSYRTALPLAAVPLLLATVAFAIRLRGRRRGATG